MGVFRISPEAERKPKNGEKMGILATEGNCNDLILGERTTTDPIILGPQTAHQNTGKKKGKKRGEITSRESAPHDKGGHFRETKTVPADSRRADRARRKAQSAKDMLGSWGKASLLFVGDARKRTAIYRMVHDEQFRPSIALIEAIEKTPLPIRVEVDTCPSCHGIHLAGDCMGRPISAVVILAPGERVTDAPQSADAPNVSRETLSPPRKRKTYHSRPCLSTDPVERIAQCERIIEEARRNE